MLAFDTPLPLIILMFLDGTIPVNDIKCLGDPADELGMNLFIQSMICESKTVIKTEHGAEFDFRKRDCSREAMVMEHCSDFEKILILKFEDWKKTLKFVHLLKNMKELVQP